MPREAATLMEALKDAETGKAQKMKGDGLDLVVPEGANEIVLEDGVSALASFLSRWMATHMYVSVVGGLEVAADANAG